MPCQVIFPRHSPPVELHWPAMLPSLGGLSDEIPPHLYRLPPPEAGKPPEGERRLFLGLSDTRYSPRSRRERRGLIWTKPSSLRPLRLCGEQRIRYRISKKDSLASCFSSIILAAHSLVPYSGRRLSLTGQPVGRRRWNRRNKPSKPSRGGRTMLKGGLDCHSASAAIWPVSLRRRPFSRFSPTVATR